LLIFFELKFLSCFKAEGLATLNSQNLWRHGPSTEELRDALLTVWAIIHMDPHEKRMLAPTINAMNIDLVCRHMLPLSRRSCADPKACAELLVFDGRLEMVEPPF
jgi:hypothetical protein